MGSHPFFESVMTEKPQIEKEAEIDVLTQVEREHQIILYNDDVNTFDHVINALVTYCDHTFVQAEQCAYIVHFSGKCAVKSGSYEELEPICSKLLELQLSAEIQ
jgi:ATP-dependent Clp protease adaptor protein ClpS